MSGFCGWGTGMYVTSSWKTHAAVDRALGSEVETYLHSSSEDLSMCVSYSSHSHDQSKFTKEVFALVYSSRWDTVHHVKKAVVAEFVIISCPHSQHREQTGSEAGPE